MADGRWLAIDWGTTNRRVYLMDAAGAVLATARDGRGVMALNRDDFPGEVAALRARHGALPILSAGMLGSTRGWRDAPYLPAPIGVDGLAAGIVRIEEADVGIVPGVAAPDGRADVMRGEEVQVLGAVAAGLAPADALFCQPGTHNKWIRVAGGRIVDLATALTGELFALLRDHSILSEMMRGAVADGPAFREGVRRAGEGAPLLTALFGVRAGVLLGRRAREDAASYASGLLIGADVAAQRIAGATVQLLADPTLGALYAAAIGEQGGSSVMIDSHAAFAAGIHAVREAGI